MALHAVSRRSVKIKSARDGDTGHVIRGIGFAYDCTCGARGSVRKSWNEAMQDGRDHQAEHAEQDGAA